MFFHLTVTSVICDAPARAFVKNIKSYSGYHGCDKCIQSGVWNGKMTFPEIDATLRTDASFDEMRDEEHHKGPSPFAGTQIQMVSQFPIDYMHLVCLGVMKRLLLLWMKGPLKCRLGSRIISNISEGLLALKDNIPSEFARKPRSLYETDRWKATEFRQFLLYTGPVVLWEGGGGAGQWLVTNDWWYYEVGYSIILLTQLITDNYIEYAKGPIIL